MSTAFQMLMAARILLQPHPTTLWLGTPACSSPAMRVLCVRVSCLLKTSNLIDDDPLPLEVIEIVVRQLDTHETLTDREKSAIIAYAFDKVPCCLHSNQYCCIPHIRCCTPTCPIIGESGEGQVVLPQGVPAQVPLRHRPRRGRRPGRARPAPAVGGHPRLDDSWCR
jgi:hypothetical protein